MVGHILYGWLTFWQEGLILIHLAQSAVSSLHFQGLVDWKFELWLLPFFGPSWVAVVLIVGVEVGEEGGVNGLHLNKISLLPRVFELPRLKEAGEGGVREAERGSGGHHWHWWIRRVSHSLEMSHIAVMIFTKPWYAHFTFSDTISECDIPVPGILLLFGWYRYRKKLVPEKSTSTGTGKIRSRKKVPVPVLEKLGPGKKYRSRNRKKLVPEKSTGTGIGKNWSRYRRIPGNSRSLYILISSCTFRHREKEMSL